MWFDKSSAEITLPCGFGAERVILNPVVDGLFYFAFKHEGRIWPHYGRFTELDRPRLLEHTWISEATKGAESIVTLTLEPRGDQTEVTLRHSGVPDDELGRRHKERWTDPVRARGGFAASRSAISQT